MNELKYAVLENVLNYTIKDINIYGIHMSGNSVSINGNFVTAEIIGCTEFKIDLDFDKETNKGTYCTFINMMADWSKTIHPTHVNMMFFESKMWYALCKKAYDIYHVDLHEVFCA